MGVRPVIGVVAVLLAAGCSSSVGGSAQPATSGASSAVADLSAVVHKDIAARDHVDGHVDYPDSPPMGGRHNAVWADCTGTVYTRQIANENAVHSLEHGAVWVTYRPGLDAAGLAALKTLVAGNDYLMMSPYPGLDRAVSVQSWGYQLKTDDAADPRIKLFIKTYRQNPKTTPEPGATCINPNFPGA
ncbi:MAG TPA: DUF3105 domain-containing protein [Mycobacteriales bacterium]|nr:DUF3105 domain-containing protein [Mycobacteriales bacterium]